MLDDVRRGVDEGRCDGGQGGEVEGTRAQDDWRLAPEVDHGRLDARRAGPAVEDEVDAVAGARPPRGRPWWREGSVAVGAGGGDGLAQTLEQGAGDRMRGGAEADRAPPPVSSGGTEAARATTRVRGPGQKASASRLARSDQSAAIVRASATPSTCAMSGWVADAPWRRRSSPGPPGRARARRARRPSRSGRRRAPLPAGWRRRARSAWELSVRRPGQPC